MTHAHAALRAVGVPTIACDCGRYEAVPATPICEYAHSVISCMLWRAAVTIAELINVAGVQA